MSSPFKPILYLKAKCPFCLKLQIFLLETGLLEGMVQREFEPGDAQEEVIRAELSLNFAVASFPTVQYAPGKYLSDSGAIVGQYAAIAAVDPSTLCVYSSFLNGMLPRQIELYEEVEKLTEQLARHETSSVVGNGA
jgi:hypothetical protein